MASLYPSSHNIIREKLTPSDYERLAANKIQASAFLEELLAEHRAHRESGCTDWFCADLPEIEMLDGLPMHSMRQVLAICLERLT